MDCCPVCNSPRRKEPDGSFSGSTVEIKINFTQSLNIMQANSYGSAHTESNLTLLSIHINPETGDFEVRDGHYVIGKGNLATPGASPFHLIESYSNFDVTIPAPIVSSVPGAPILLTGAPEVDDQT